MPAGEMETTELPQEEVEQ
jgi:hypothetical protein